MSGGASRAGLLGFLLRWLNPVVFVKLFIEAARVLIEKSPLAWSLARRDLHARHKAQLLGAMWTVAHPFMLMLIFLFIFGVVFKARIETSFEMPRDYTTYILGGLVPWLACVPAIITTCNSIVGSAALVKQFHFDTIVLPMRDVMSTFYFWGVGVAFITVYAIVSGNGVSWTYALLPFAFACTFAFLIGLGWMLASLTVFFRDLKEFVTVSMTLFSIYCRLCTCRSGRPACFRA